jgi:predicted RNA binding protein YcfA (HicA-like mRNA interferase family)
MGQLSGFRYRDIVQRLKLFGFSFLCQAAGSHEIWHNKSTGRYTTIPNHTGDMPLGYSQGNFETSRYFSRRFPQHETFMMGSRRSVSMNPVGSRRGAVEDVVRKDG